MSSTSSEDENKGSFKNRKTPQKKTCNLCQTEEIAELGSAALLEKDGIRAHYFCLLFSSGLGQKGDELEGLNGFLPGDVRKELKRGARLKCVHCKLKGATVGCAKAECKKSYHLPCGMKNGSLQEFFDQFKSFCYQHRPTQKISKKKSSQAKKCSLCKQMVTERSALWSPCCSSCFHRQCLQRKALEEDIFKCPHCGNTDNFDSEMQRFGIYLPQLNSSGQTTSNSREACGAKVCFCDKENGRHYNFPDGLWELLVCFSCGSDAIHAKCGGMEDLIDPQWHCYVCRRVVRGEEEMAKRRKRPINEIWGTAMGRKPQTSNILASPSQDADGSSPTTTNIIPGLLNGKFDYSNTVTITPISKDKMRDHHTNFPMRSELPGGVEIRMVMPESQKKDTMKLSLDDIIIAGLERKPQETNYKCTKAFAEQYDQVQPQENQRNSIDLQEPQGSPGDSDYESAQEQNGIPFKIRRNSNIIPAAAAKKAKTEVFNPALSIVDSQIQKSIKDFFTAAS